MAAGSSSRLDSSIPKPYIMIDGKPILWYSINIFNKQEFVDKIFVVISNKMQQTAKRIQKKYFTKFNKFSGFIIGGESRTESVINGLSALWNYKKDGLVAIHDSARPFIPQETLQKTYNMAKEVGASAPGVKVVDTIKQTDESGNIIKHLKRETLIAIQTPQIFDFVKLWNVYNEIDIKTSNFTDDTQVFGIKYKVHIVEGHNDLFKITYKEDLNKARVICKNYKD